MPQGHLHQGWKKHAKAAETALSRGNPVLARRELDLALQASSLAPGSHKPKVRVRPRFDDPDDNEDYEEDENMWISDLKAALEQAENDPVQQQPLHRKPSLTENRALYADHAKGVERLQQDFRHAIEKVIQKLGVREYDDCTDFVVSLLEDIELEIEQGETREQIIGDVLTSTLDIEEQNDMGIQDAKLSHTTLSQIDEAVKLILDIWTARTVVPRARPRNGKGGIEATEAAKKAAEKLARAQRYDSSSAASSACPQPSSILSQEADGGGGGSVNHNHGDGTAVERVVPEGVRRRGEGGGQVREERNKKKGTSGSFISDRETARDRERGISSTKQAWTKGEEAEIVLSKIAPEVRQPNITPQLSRVNTTKGSEEKGTVKHIVGNDADGHATQRLKSQGWDGKEKSMTEDNLVEDDDSNIDGRVQTVDMTQAGTMQAGRKKKSVNRWVQSKRNQILNGSINDGNSNGGGGGGGNVGSVLVGLFSSRGGDTKSPTHDHAAPVHTDIPARVREIGENNERHLNEQRQRAVKDLRKSDTLKTTSASFDSTKQKNNDGKLAAVPTMGDTSLGVLGVGEVASGEGARGGADGINLGQQQVVCSFWGVERLDLPHEWRYKGHLAKRISDTVFSGNVVAGNLSYLMSKELQMRKAVDRVCGTDAARLPPAPATRPSTPTYREKEVRNSQTGKCSGANLEVYQDLLRQHTQVEELAYNVGFECVAAGLQRSLACASAALGLPIHLLQHWQQASIEGGKEGDTRAQVRAQIGQAEVLCTCSKFEEAHACLEQALALVRKAKGAAEEEDILCVERAHVQVHDLRVLEGLQSAEQAYVAGNVHKALQGYSVTGDTAARALILVLSVSDKEQRLAVKREAARGKRAKDKEIAMGKDGSKSLPPAIRPRRIFLEEEDGGDTPGSLLPQRGGKDSDYYRENVAAQVHDYNSTQLSKIQRRLARNRYKALAASACCMMKVGDMSSALAAWHQVFKASEALTREADILEGRIAAFQSMALAYEVQGNLEESVACARQAQQLKAKWEQTPTSATRSSELSGDDTTATTSVALLSTPLPSASIPLPGRKSVKSTLCVCS